LEFLGVIDIMTQRVKTGQTEQTASALSPDELAVRAKCTIFLPDEMTPMQSAVLAVIDEAAEPTHVTH
jgi:hypothetical protein